MSNLHAVFIEFNGKKTQVGVARQDADGFVLLLGAATLGAAQAGSVRSPSSGGGGATFPNYGRSKGAPIAGASMQELEYYAKNAVKSINDPSKSRWREKESALLEALNAEIIAQGGQPVELEPAYGGGNSGGPDDSLPF